MIWISTPKDKGKDFQISLSSFVWFWFGVSLWVWSFSCVVLCGIPLNSQVYEIRVFVQNCQVTRPRCRLWYTEHWVQNVHSLNSIVMLVSRNGLDGSESVIRSSTPFIQLPWWVFLHIDWSLEVNRCIVPVVQNCCWRWYLCEERWLLRLIWRRVLGWRG